MIEVKAPKITIVALVNFHIIYLLCKRWLSLKRYFNFRPIFSKQKMLEITVQQLRYPVELKSWQISEIILQFLERLFENNLSDLATFI